jgi:SMC interacting uncharacterized protein involved in chromosome segregation
MEAIIKIIEELVNSGKVNGFFLTAMFAMAGVGVAVFYVGKFIFYVQNHFNNKEETQSKELTDELKATLQKDHQYLLKLLEDIDDRLKTIEAKGEHGLALGKELENELSRLKDLMEDVKTVQTANDKAIDGVERDIDSLVTDSKEQYAEITRQVQSLQKDLASLHGTIIGLNTQRSRLK